MKKLIAVLAALTMLFVCGWGRDHKDSPAQTTAMAPTMAPTTLLMSGTTPIRIPSGMTSAKAWTMQAMPSEMRWMMSATPSAMAQTP